MRLVGVPEFGNPLVNEVIIPLGQKDKFNRTTPDADAANYGKYVLEPELAAVLNVLFPDMVNAPEKNRTDIVQRSCRAFPASTPSRARPPRTPPTRSRSTSERRRRPTRNASACWQGQCRLPERPPTDRRRDRHRSPRRGRGGEGERGPTRTVARAPSSGS